MNNAPGLSLIMGPMGELVKNAELGRKVAAEGFNGPALDPFSPRAACRVTGCPGVCCGWCGGTGCGGWQCCHVGNCVLQMMWRVSVGRPVMDRLERCMR
jgi:hypothetical protein